MNHIKRNANKYLLTRFSHSIITFIINNNTDSSLLGNWSCPVKVQYRLVRFNIEDLCVMQLNLYSWI